MDGTPTTGFSIASMNIRPFGRLLGEVIAMLLSSLEGSSDECGENGKDILIIGSRPA